MRRVFFWAAVVVFVAPGMISARAANLEIMQGEVLLSRGGPYQSVRGSSEVLPGDTLVSRAGSTAKITFADGCETYLGMGMAFTVEAKSPCASGRSSAIEAGATSPASQDATAAVINDGWAEGTEALAISQDAQASLMPYLLGAAAIGGVAVAVSALGGGGDSKPVSP